MRADRLVPPKPLTDLTLKYPDGQSGDHDVLLEVVVDISGNVTAVTALTGEPPFTILAVESAKSWSFTPAMSQGHPVSSRIRIQARFEQQSPEPAPSSVEARERADTRNEVPEAKTPAIDVTVVGERRPAATHLNSADVSLLPGAFGDPFRAIEVLPGVTPIVSGLPYFYVRGAPPGDVGYYFAGVPVPALYHIGAGPGVLHPAFVEQVVLHSSAYTASHGRHSGGLLLGKLAKPKYETRGEFGVRLTEAGGLLEAPFDAGNGSVMVGGRFGYPGLILSLVQPEVELSYWDYQGLINYQLSAHDQLDLLVFGASDFLGRTLSFSADGSKTAEPELETLFQSRFHRFDLRWTSTTHEGQSFAAATVGVDDSEATDLGNARSSLFGFRGHRTLSLARDILFRVGADARAEFRRIEVEEDEDPDTLLGGSAGPGDAPPRRGPVRLFPFFPNAGETPHRASSDDPSAGNSKFEDDLARDAKDAVAGRRDDYVLGVYAELDWDLSDRLRFSPGLRFDAYFSGVNAAFAIEPRLNLRYQATPSISLQTAFGIAHQMPAFIAPVPGIQGSLEGGLQRSVQHSFGVDMSLPADFSSSVNLFHSLFFSVSDPLGVAHFNDVVDNPDASLFDRGQGRSVGLEVMIRRSLARDLGGILSYTWSRSTRSQGRGFGPARFDRSHVLNLAVTKDLGKNWRLNSRLLFYTGTPAKVAYLAAAKAPPRSSPYWRLDWRLEKRWYMGTPNAWWAFIVEVLNTTLREEPSAASCHAFACSDESLGPITIPNLGVEAKF